MSKSKDGNAAVAVLDYLNRQNRPYSAIDIVNNLHKEYGKTAVVKACDTLTESGQIKEKVYGKQKVYVADQSQYPEVNESEIKEMDASISKLTQEYQTDMAEIKKLEEELKALNSCLSTVEAQQQLTEKTTKCAHYKSKLKQLKEGGNVIDPAEKDKVYKNRQVYVKEWRKRRRITNDILNAILEGYPKPKKTLYEDIGIETDEEFGVKPPDI